MRGISLFPYKALFGLGVGALAFHGPKTDIRGRVHVDMLPPGEGFQSEELTGELVTAVFSLRLRSEMWSLSIFESTVSSHSTRKHSAPACKSLDTCVPRSGP